MSDILKLRESIRFQQELVETINARKAAADIIKRRSEACRTNESPRVTLHFLKEGAQGNVYYFTILDEDDKVKQAVDYTKLERSLTKIAFKISREWFPKVEDPEQEDVEAQRIQKENHNNELKIAKEIQAIEHPNMVKIYHVGEGYIEMEKVGDPVWMVQEKMQKDTNLSIDKRKGISADLALGATRMILALVHSHIQPNDAHRDNCLIGLDDGKLKFIDGGLRRKIEAPYFILQDPQFYDNEKREDYKDYHPIDTIIKILQESGAVDEFKEMIISLQMIGQDKEQKKIFFDKGLVQEWEYFGETLEDVIASKDRKDSDKKRAFLEIKERLAQVSVELEKYADAQAAQEYLSLPSIIHCAE